MKKYLIAAGSVIGSAVATLSAFAGTGAAPETIIPVASSTLLADMTSYVPTLFNDLFPVIALVLGVVLGFWIISKAVGLIAGKFRSK
ncbi:MAG: hypothetical protein WC310_05870 [Patescibacteria group bacterium]|jgi:hypothetical protein